LLRYLLVPYYFSTLGRSRSPFLSSMFFAREGKRPQPFQCSVVLGASQLTDVTCARLFALPDGEFLQPLDVGFPGIFFLLFHHPDKRGEQYECKYGGQE
jgi:hypothetical protein